MLDRFGPDLLSLKGPLKPKEEICVTADGVELPAYEPLVKFFRLVGRIGANLMPSVPSLTG